MTRLSRMQQTLVRRSFGKIACRHQAVAWMFYERLFQIAPELKPLFAYDARQQGERFMQMLAILVNALDQPEVLQSTARYLAQRHARYGVKPAHHAFFREALLWALQQCLGAGFTPKVREAWEAAYDVFAAAMEAGKIAEER